VSADRVARLTVAAQRRRVHVTQISRDGDLLRLPHDSEPVQRQLEYARELSVRAPGSIVTIVVLTTATATSGWQRNNLRVVALPATASAVFALPRMLYALHRATPITVITTQVPYDEGWMALALGRVWRIPVIAQVHTDLFADASAAPIATRLRRAAHHWATRRLLGGFSAVRTVSSANRMAVARFTRHVPLATIPVPVSMVASRTPPLKTSSPRVPLVLFVGRLAPEKDLMAWLQVARLVSFGQPHARFVLVGDGPERARLEQAAAHLGLSGIVRFAGFVPYTALPELYAKATTVLMTSPAEGFARVLVEAASQGTPAVSISSAGPRDIVINGVTGFLHDAGDIAGLAHSVSTLLREPARAAMMGTQARAFVSVKFDPRRLRSEWVDLWLETARQAHRS
jgi:glycosyltransferase involved in cell wall biosynthesis